jgi:GrpB-like predicted nucleotidyltransferase (UPF0157 family)
MAAGPLQIASYDPQWARRFDRERARLAAALGPLALRIDHNGSTAVPGLAAKPVIDIQISVAPLHPIDPYIRALVALGYVHVPDPDDAVCPFLHRPGEWPHTHHVHLVEAGGLEERRTLAFRDYLRDDAGARHEYEQLKRRLAAAHSAADAASREAYADAKSAFVERIVQAALAAGYPRA